MPAGKPRAQWTEDQIRRVRALTDRDRLRELGLRLTDLERAVARPTDSTLAVRTVYWSRCEKAPPTETELQAMEAVIAAAERGEMPDRTLTRATITAGHAPGSKTEEPKQTPLERYRELADLVGEPDKDEPDPVRAFVDKHRGVLLGVLLDRALNSKSDNSRIAAAEALLSRIDGKPQRQILQGKAVDDGDNVALLEMLYGLRAQRLIDQCSRASAADLDEIKASSSRLPDHHRERVAQRIDDRLRELSS